MAAPAEEQSEPKTAAVPALPPAAGAGAPGGRSMDLENELTCSICSELFYQPLTVLDCLHTFCGVCLAEWFTFQHNYHVNNPMPPSPTPVYNCPSCRAVVRDTKHNATVQTLLDMFLAARPGKQRSDEEKRQIALKYKPGDKIFPRDNQPPKSSRERRVDERDQMLMQRVREMSLREVGVSAGSGGEGGGNAGSLRLDRRRRESDRSHDGREGHSRQQSQNRAPSREARTQSRHRTDSQSRSRQDSQDGTHHSRAEHGHPTRNDSGNGPRSQRGARFGHQSSLRGLIAADSHIQREIEEFSRQIQEEGLLDGLDLERIDLSEDTDLSRRIIAAYRRRHRLQVRNEAEEEEVETRSTQSPRESRRTSSQRHSGATTNEGVQLTDHTSQSRPNDSAVPSRPGETLRPANRILSRGAGHMHSTSFGQVETQPMHSNSIQQQSRRDSDDRRSPLTPGRTSLDTARPAPVSSTNGPSASAVDSSTPGRSRSLADTPHPVASSGRSSLGNHFPGAAADRGRENEPQAPRPNRASHSQLPPIAITSPSPAPSLVGDIPAPLSLPKQSKPVVPPIPAFRVISSMPKPATAPEAATTSTLLSPTSHAGNRLHSHYEPDIQCSSCQKLHIQYDVHYNCMECDGGSWTICMDCYRARKGCKNWLGFGREAQDTWEKKLMYDTNDIDPPHTLVARRFRRPEAPPRINESGQSIVLDDPMERLESGCFCAGCFAWANECYWRCTHCNFGDWGYCNDCVNIGHCCTHALLPLMYRPDETEYPASPIIPGSPVTGSRPASMRSVSPLRTAIVSSSSDMFYPYVPLSFNTSCDLCGETISHMDLRLHCYQCRSRLVDDASIGDYDVCLPCYKALPAQGLISKENGISGWRRCLNGHRMSIVAFEERDYGQRRFVVQGMVGGRSLKVEEFNDKAERWKWPTSSGNHWASRIVSKNVAESVAHMQQQTTLGHTRNNLSMPLHSPSTLAAPPRPDSSSSALSASDQSGSLGGGGPWPAQYGPGRYAIALWAWFPPSDDPSRADELRFPAHAQLTEVVEVNETFWRGEYMGRVAFLPAAYIDLLNESHIKSLVDFANKRSRSRGRAVSPVSSTAASGGGRNSHDSGPSGGGGSRMRSRSSSAAAAMFPHIHQLKQRCDERRASRYS